MTSTLTFSPLKSFFYVLPYHILLMLLPSHKRICTNWIYQYELVLSRHLLDWISIDLLHFMVPSSNTSRKKWYWTLMCLVLEWNARFLTMCKRFWLSQNREIFSCLCPSSSNNLLIQIAYLKACVATMYPASIVDRAIIVWNFPANVNTYLIVDFLLSRSFAKSEST